MATIRRGKKARTEVNLIQWCNDWFSVDMPDGTSAIVKPTNLLLNKEEIAEVRANPCGMLFHWFELQDDGKFVKKRRSNAS